MGKTMMTEVMVNKNIKKTNFVLNIPNLQGTAMPEIVRALAPFFFFGRQTSNIQQGQKKIGEKLSFSELVQIEKKIGEKNKGKNWRN